MLQPSNPFCFRSIVLFSLCLWGGVQSAQSETFSYSFEMRNRLEIQRNLLQAQSLELPTWTLNDTFYGLSFRGDFELSNREKTLFSYIELSTGQIRFDDVNQDGSRDTSFNGEGFSQAWRNEDLFFRQAYFEYNPSTLPWLSLRLGKQRLRIANGLILDDFEWAGHFRSHPDSYASFPIGVTLDVGAIDRESPFVHLAFDWVHRQHQAGIFGVYFRDRSEQFSNTLFNDATNEQLRNLVGRLLNADALSDRANYAWFGAKGEHDFNSFLLQWTAVGQVGNIRVDVGPNRLVEFNTMGWLADLLLEFELTKATVLSPYLYYASGDSQPAQALQGQRLNSFIAISPLIGRTNIFFNGGPDQDISNRSFTLSGVSGRGVFSPGINLDWEGSTLGARLAAAAFWATNPGSNGRFYGFEWNTDLYVELHKNIEAILSGSVFLPGSFFVGAPRAAGLIILGIDVHI